MNRVLLLALLASSLPLVASSWMLQPRQYYADVWGPSASSLLLDTMMMTPSFVVPSTSPLLRQLMQETNLIQQN
jgi:hypothetical protein